MPGIYHVYGAKDATTKEVDGLLLMGGLVGVSECAFVERLIACSS